MGGTTRDSGWGVKVVLGVPEVEVPSSCLFALRSLRHNTPHEAVSNPTTTATTPAREVRDGGLEDMIKVILSQGNKK